MSNWNDLVLIHGNVEGARAAFERACESIIRSKYPSQKVRGIRVEKGDGGIDIYVGELGVAPIDVYQCKYFINGFSDSQKSQIRESYKVASTNASFTLKDWYLCLPENLNVADSSWFDGWSSKQIKAPKLIPAGELLTWAENLGLASTIFKRHDSIKLDEILTRLKQENQDPWNALVDQTETDCYRVLLTLVRAHLRCLSNKYPHLEQYGDRAESGDKLDTCQYFKSALAGPLTESEKVWIFNILSDFTLEPIAYRFIRRYDVLVEKAKGLDRIDELSTSEFYSIWRMFRGPEIKHLRDLAEWKVTFS